MRPLEWALLQYKKGLGMGIQSTMQGHVQKDRIYLETPRTVENDWQPEEPNKRENIKLGGAYWLKAFNASTREEEARGSQ